MNKKMLTLSLAVLVLCATAIARVPSGDEANMTFSSVSSGAKLELYDGGQTKINVPETHGGADVTTIGATAFTDPAIEMIYLPITTTTVEENAFLNCGDNVIVILELSDPLADVPKDVAKWGMGDYTAEIRYFTDTGRTDLFIVKGEICEGELIECTDCSNISTLPMGTLMENAGLSRFGYNKITYNRCIMPPDGVEYYDISAGETECVLMWEDGEEIWVWFSCDMLEMPENMYMYYSRLGTIDTIAGLHNLDTSKTTDMSYAFFATTFNDLDLSHFDVSNVTTTVSMFDHGRVNNSLILDGWNISNTLDLSSMFVHSFMPLVMDLSSFDFSHQPTVTNMLPWYDVVTVYVKSQADKDYLIANASLDSGLDIIIGTP